MRKVIRLVAICVALLSGAAILFSLGAKSVESQATVYHAPRLKDGHPDLNGIWQALNEVAFERGLPAPEPAADREHPSMLAGEEGAPLFLGGFVVHGPSLRGARLGPTRWTEAANRGSISSRKRGNDHGPRRAHGAECRKFDRKFSFQQHG